MTTKRQGWTSWATAATLAIGCASGCGAPANDGNGATVATESAAIAARHEPADAALFGKDERPFGLDMTRWSEDWWRWAYSMPVASNPNATLTVDCDVGQEGPMFFLPGYFAGGATTRTCSVSRHQPIAVSLVSLLNDYPCPDPTFKPAPGQSLFDFLLAGATSAQTAEVASVAASLDGQPFTDLASYHYDSKQLFYLTGDKSLQTIDGCVTGSRQPAVSASYFIVLKPLSPGRHVLTASVTAPSGTAFSQSTTTLDVR
jgi:hypothetical protein